MFERQFFSGTKALKLPSYNSGYAFYTGDQFALNTPFFVLRNQELERAGLEFTSRNINLNADWYGETYKPTEDTLLKFSDLTYRSQKIYDNQKVSILTNG